MKRYAVMNLSAGITHSLHDELSEAIASAVRLQDEGRKVTIHDCQGAGPVLATAFVAQEAEAYLGREIGATHIIHALTIEELLAKAAETAPSKHIYHWDV